MRKKETQSMNKQILIIDDQQRILKSLKRNLEHHNYRVECAQNSTETLNILKSSKSDLILLDVMLGKEKGIELLSKLKEDYPQIPIIMITGHGTIEMAVEAVKLGAYDFLEKPLLFKKLLITIERALELTEIKKENDSYKEINGSQFLTTDRTTIEMIEKARRIASTKLPILIYGESGTGKEVLTKELHEASPLKNKPLLQINCAAISESLLDSELFGHSKGAFTGAHADYTGVFEKASGGTLHLDEIADMSLETQAKILRVLENGEYKRIGEQQVRHADLRFIASTNIDLNERVQEGRFRQDLLFRLNAAVIRIPPLRERIGDVFLIAEHFLKKKSLLLDKKFQISDEVKDLFSHHLWHGNVRELRNTIDFASAVASTNTISKEDLPESFFAENSNQNKDGYIDTENTSSTRRVIRENNPEKRKIIQALEDSKYNKKKAAEMLNISRRSLYNKIARLKIEI